MDSGFRGNDVALVGAGRLVSKSLIPPEESASTYIFTRKTLVSRAARVYWAEGRC